MTTKQRRYYKSDNIVKGSADNIEMAYLLASESSIVRLFTSRRTTNLEGEINQKIKFILE